jgi:hypothetical protein
MYSYEDRIRAVKLYIKLDERVPATTFHILKQQNTRACIARRELITFWLIRALLIVKPLRGKSPQVQCAYRRKKTRRSGLGLA